MSGEPGVAAVDPMYLARIEQILRSTRALAGGALLLAIVAGGLAVWSLIRTQDLTRQQQRAGAAEISALNSRIGALERRVNGGGISRISAQEQADSAAIAQLRRDLQRTQGQVAKAASASSTSASIAQLNQRVDGLSRQVSSLASRPNTPTNPSTTTTP